MEKALPVKLTVHLLDLFLDSIVYLTIKKIILQNTYAAYYFDFHIWA